MSDLIPVEPSEDEESSGVLRFVLDLEGGSVDPTPPVEVITDYELLTNLPTINGVTLIGNKLESAYGLQRKMTSIPLSTIAALPDL